MQATNSRWEEHEKRLLLFAITNMADELLSASMEWDVVIRKSDNYVRLLIIQQNGISFPYAKIYWTRFVII